MNEDEPLIRSRKSTSYNKPVVVQMNAAQIDSYQKFIELQKQQQNQQRRLAPATPAFPLTE
ncbi:hypothetical protein FBU30_005285, partial [Linnemannia zychae]